MNKQEQIELCTLLAKLLLDMNNESTVIYTGCDLSFIIAGQRVNANIKFEIGDLNE